MRRNPGAGAGAGVGSERCESYGSRDCWPVINIRSFALITVYGNVSEKEEMSQSTDA